MSDQELIRYRRLAMEDAWKNELDLRKLDDIHIRSTILRKTSWTINLSCVWWETVSKIEGFWKLRIIKPKLPMDKVLQKTWWGRSKVVFDLRGGGRLIIHAKNACFGRKEPIRLEEKALGRRHFDGNCKDKITKPKEA